MITCSSVQLAGTVTSGGKRIHTFTSSRFSCSSNHWFTKLELHVVAGGGVHQVVMVMVEVLGWTGKYASGGGASLKINYLSNTYARTVGQGGAGGVLLRW